MNQTAPVRGVELILEGDMVLHHQERTGVPFEADSLQAWQEAASRPGAVMVDVGAYTGIYAICAAQQGAQVLAFEPNAAALARARQNATINGVEVAWDSRAVSDSPRELRMQVSAPLTSAAQVSERGRTVAATSIDSLGLAALSALKIDVEGHELPVLTGAVLTIARHKPLIVVEVLSSEARARVEGVLQPLGYSFKLVDEWNLLCR